jgi:hypothetical protein
MDRLLSSRVQASRATAIESVYLHASSAICMSMICVHVDTAIACVSDTHLVRVVGSDVCSQLVDSVLHHASRDHAAAVMIKIHTHIIISGHSLRRTRCREYASQHKHTYKLRSHVCQCIDVVVWHQKVFDGVSVVLLRLRASDKIREPEQARQAQKLSLQRLANTVGAHQ